MACVRGGGGYFVYYWVEVCCWDSETLTLYHQTMFSCILQPYSRLVNDKK